MFLPTKRAKHTPVMHNKNEHDPRAAAPLILKEVRCAARYVVGAYCSALRSRRDWHIHTVRAMSRILKRSHLNNTYLY